MAIKKEIKKTDRPNTKDQFIKQAHTRLLETALELERVMLFLDAMAKVGNQLLREYGGNKPKYYEGLGMMRDAVYAQYCESLKNCFVFCSTSEGLRDYAMEKLEEAFDEKETYTVMHFLDQWGNMPRGWKTDDEKSFRAEVRETIKKAKAKPKAKPKKDCAEPLGLGT